MGHSLRPSLYYFELTAALRRSYDGPVWCDCERRVEQIADRPRAFGYPEGLCGGAPCAELRNFVPGDRLG